MKNRKENSYWREEDGALATKIGNEAAKYWPASYSIHDAAAAQDLTKDDFELLS